MYFTFPQFNKFSLKPFFRKFSEKFLIQKLDNLFPNYNFVLTDSGRSAFQLAIKDLGLENFEMILPAYLCDIFRPILKHFNIKPVYLDTDPKTFHANFSNIENLITSKTKSILICHTYGLPVELDQLLKIAKNYNLKIIEDCAHLSIDLPRAESRGDALFFSFSKIFPVTNGGLLITKNDTKTELKKYKFRFFNIIKYLRLYPLLANLSEKFRPEEGLKENSRKAPRKISKTSLKIINYCLDNFNEQNKTRIDLAKYFQEKLLEMEFKMQESTNNTFSSCAI